MDNYIEKNIDLLCYDFIKQIKATINNCGLSISVVESLMKNLMVEIEQTKNNYLINKLKERETELEKFEQEVIVELPVTRIQGEE